MARRRHRQEFRNALDNAENHRPYCIRHHDPVRCGRNQGKKAGFFSLIRSPAAIAKNAKTQVA
jgi:hypothetical protein